MDDLLSSIRKIMAEEETDPRRPAPTRRSDPFPAHAKRNEEVPVDLSPSDADRLPELVERSIMNAFAGLDETDADDAGSSPSWGASSPGAGSRGHREEEDNSAAMASLADALAREFSSEAGHGAGGGERDDARHAPSLRPYTLSEPGLEDATLEDFDEAHPHETADSPEFAPRAGEPEAQRTSRSAAARVSSLKGRLDPRDREDAQEAFYRPRSAMDPQSAHQPLQGAHAPAPAFEPREDAGGDPEPAPAHPPCYGTADPQAAPHGAHPAGPQGLHAASDAWYVGPLPQGHPAAPGAPQPDPGAHLEGGNVFRRPGTRQAPRRELPQGDEAVREAAQREAAEREAVQRETAQREAAALGTAKHEADEPEPDEREAAEREAVEREAAHFRPGKAPTEEELTSAATRESIHNALEQLSRTVLPEAPRTLEDLVREMMRPMLREWLEANLATIVERTVRQEIERVAARRT